jgi:hypothetical protein
MAGRPPVPWGSIPLLADIGAGDAGKGKVPPGLCLPAPFAAKTGANGFFLDRLPAVINKFLNIPKPNAPFSFAERAMSFWLKSPANAFTEALKTQVIGIDRCFVGVKIEDLKAWTGTSEFKAGKQPTFGFNWIKKGHQDRQNLINVLSDQFKLFRTKKPAEKIFPFPDPPITPDIIPVASIPDYSTNVKDWAHLAESWRIGQVDDGTGFGSLDDIGLFIGRYNWGTIVLGSVEHAPTPQAANRVRVETAAILVYAFDCYDFEGRQALGVWNTDPGEENIFKVSLKPFPFDPSDISTDPHYYPPHKVLGITRSMSDTTVGNSSFRRFREVSCRGGDFLVLSNMERIEARHVFHLDADSKKEIT